MPRDPNEFHIAILLGWFAPETRTLFSVNLGGVDICFTAMGLWDAHLDGDVGLIQHYTPHSKQRILEQVPVDKIGDRF